MRHGHPLNAARRRARKEQLARRHGQRCTYCRRPFADLREATLDHIAPKSLWRSWSVTSLMLACAGCNQAKADRLPLSMALLLVFTYGSEQSAMGVHEQSGARVDSESADSYAVDWALLSRLAHAHQSTFTAVWQPDSIGDGSTPDLRDCTRHAVRHATATRSIGQPDCLRAPRFVRTCSRPTGEVVCA